MSFQRRSDGSLPLNPGLLNDRVVIQRATKTQNAYGEDVITWSPVMTIWAHVRAMVGQELQSVQQTFAEARFKLRTYYPQTPIKREDRAIWQGRTLDILDAEDPDGVRRELVIYAREWTE